MSATCARSIPSAPARPAADILRRAYIRHLFKSGEMLAMRLCVPQLWFYNTLMEKIRQSLEDGTFAEFKENTRIFSTREYK